MEIAELLQMVVDEEASDLHLTVGTPPQLRISGHLVPLTADPLEPKDTEKFMRSISSDEHIEKVRKEGGVDFGFSFGKIARFRVSVYRQRGSYGLALRLIPSNLLTLEGIGFSSVMK
ncbi:MAG: type IV pili twitching motility protein PilT, partial [Chlamydiota bacterium]|nr:type IV pili twitching motility protein PilT [Chlamydiota bacterium]